MECRESVVQETLRWTKHTHTHTHRETGRSSKRQMEILFWPCCYVPVIPIYILDSDKHCTAQDTFTFSAELRGMIIIKEPLLQFNILHVMSVSTSPSLFNSVTPGLKYYFKYFKSFEILSNLPAVGWGLQLFDYSMGPTSSIKQRYNIRIDFKSYLNPGLK